MSILKSFQNNNQKRNNENIINTDYNNFSQMNYQKNKQNKQLQTTNNPRNNMFTADPNIQGNIQLNSLSPPPTLSPYVQQQNQQNMFFNPEQMNNQQDKNQNITVGNKNENQRPLSWDGELPQDLKNFDFQGEQFEEEEDFVEDEDSESKHPQSCGYYFGESDQEEEEEQEETEFTENNQGHSMHRKTTKQLDEAALKVNIGCNNACKSKLLRNPIKLMVSKKKKRWESEEFSLDLTYITPKVIAMGFPAQKFESLYRNDRNDVKNFFKKMHNNNYKIYNLCSERKYDQNEFILSAHYPFEDHQAPQFTLIYKFCKDLFKFIHEDEKGLNTAGVHCKAGKGRTGVMICCYLIYSSIFDKAIDALRYYGLMRTKNKKGVTIPSQIRYVQYFEKALHCSWKLDNFPNICVKLMKIKLVTIPNFNLFGGCEPYFQISYHNSDSDEISYNSLDYFKIQKYNKEAYIEFIIDEYLVKGDVLIQFFNKTIIKKREKMFQFWFNCAFFEPNGVMILDKSMLDLACKDKNQKHFSDAFYVEVHAVHPAQDERIEIMEKSYIEINKAKRKEQSDRVPKCKECDEIFKFGTHN